MLKIRILNSQEPKESKEITLNPALLFPKECFIGRGNNNHLWLNEERVSILHGKICLKDEKYYYVDLGSTNGSLINTEAAKVNKMYLLKVGSSIQLGCFTFIIIEIGEIAPPLTPEEYMPVAMISPAEIQRWEKGKITVRCVRIIDENDDVKTFCFVANPPVLFSYKPGQFVTLNLEIEGKTVLRSYSISSSPSRPHTLEITVKRVPPPPDSKPGIPPGLGSNWLHDNIKVGSEVTLNGPRGEFTCFANPSQKLLMISAGSGITPMMSMSRWMVDTASYCDIVFLHSARSPSDIIFRKRLELITELYPNFHLAITITRAEPDNNWKGLTGRIDAAMLKEVATDLWERTVYVCGSDKFMAEVKKMLKGLGFPMQNYYEESFGSPGISEQNKPKTDEEKPSSSSRETSQEGGGIRKWFIKLAQSEPEGMSPPKSVPQNKNKAELEPIPAPPSEKVCVVFSKSGKEIVWNGEESIWELADQNGVKINSNCFAGNCGNCKTRMLSGKVNMQEYNPDALPEDERQQGYILTCISQPIGRVELDA